MSHIGGVSDYVVSGSAHHASNLSPSNYMGSYHVPNDFACCLFLKKLKIKARTK